jgi:histidinol-phosphate aminotransferase
MTTQKPNAPEPKTGILDISPYVAGKSTAPGGQKIIKLSSNETPLGASPRALAAYVAHTAKLNRYPDSSAAELRAAIADTYSLPAAQIICGAGSDELIGLLVHAYAGAGDEVLYSEHGFLMYKIYTLGNGATPVTAKETNLTTSVDALLAAVTPRTKIVFVANPNNPTGTYISGAELKRLRDGLPAHVILAVDGAYAEYVDNADYSNGKELVDNTNNTIMLRTFSKIYGLSSLRLGWAYAPAAIIDVLNRVRGPFNISGASIAAGIEAVKDVEFTDAARSFNTQWRRWLAEEFSALGLRVVPSVGNFLLVEFPHEGKTASAANDHLMSQGIIPREVGNYGLPNHLRISIGLEEDNKALIAALKQFMAA